MAQINDFLNTLNANFKEVYADKIKNLIPDGVVLLKMIPFIEKPKQLGNLYHQPVVLGLEHGFTYGGPNGDAFNLNEAVAGVIQDARVQGYEVVLRSKISAGAISRSGTDKKAFQDATKLVIDNMLRSFTRRMEVMLMYGRSGLCKIDSVSGNAFVIKLNSWAPGIWAGSEGMYIDIYNSTTLLGTAKVTNISFDTHTVTLDSIPAGSAAGNDVFYKGAYGNEFYGVDAIIRNTGTIFNISAASYALWQGNVLGNSGTPRNATLALVEAAVTKSVEKGLVQEDVVVIINPSPWDNLLTEQAGKRMYDSSYKPEKAVAGHKAIEFYGKNGMIKIVPSIFCKLGSAYILPPEEFIRIGSSDITFDMPGSKGQFIMPLVNANGYEMRAYSDQSLFCAAPGKCTVLDDIQ